MATTVENLVLKVKVDGDGAIKNLSGTIQKLSADVAAFGSQGGAFTNVIDGILGKLGPMGAAAAAASTALAALGLKATQIAGEIADIRDATGISAGALLNFKQSLIDAGGGVDSFAKFASKLSISVSEANSGNEKLQKSFQDLGVYVRSANGELRPTEAILQDVLKALGGIDDPARRAGLAVQLLGKEAAKIDWSNVAAGQDAVTDAQIAQLDKYNQAIDKLRNSLERQVLSFFGQIAVDIDVALKKGNELEKKLNDIGKAQVAPGFTNALRGYLGMEPRSEQNMPVFTRELSAAEKAAFERRKYEAEMDKLMKPYTARSNTRETDGGDYGARSEAGIRAAADSAKRVEQSRLEAQRSALLQGQGEIARLRINAEQEIAKQVIEIRAKEKLSDAEKETEVAAKRKEINAKLNLEISDALKKQNQFLADQSMAYDTATKALIKKYQLESSLVGLGQDQIEVIRARAEAEKTANDQILQLQKKRIDAEPNLAAQIDKQIAAIQKQSAAQAQSVEQEILNAQQKRKTFELEISAREQLIKIQELQAGITGQNITYEQQLLSQLNKEKEKYATYTVEQVNQLKAQAAALDAAAVSARNLVVEREAQRDATDFSTDLVDNLKLEMTLGEDNRRVLQAQQSEYRKLEQSRRKIIDQYGEEKNLSEAAKAAKASELSAAEFASSTRLKAAEEAIRADAEQRNSFSTGWTLAYNKYAEDAQRSSEQAGRYFETFTRGFEDIFYNMAKSGDFSFKSLKNGFRDVANSIIADFVRIQAKKAILGIFGGFGGEGGGGGLFGGSIIPGFLANGGPATAGQPYIVGERGPELFVPRASGTVVPNGEFGMAGAGGVTQTSVTYNINAVDASSFKSMVARDPQFLYAVTEQGRRSLPGRR